MIIVHPSPRAFAGVVSFRAKLQAPQKRNSVTLMHQRIVVSRVALQERPVFAPSLAMQEVTARSWPYKVLAAEGLLLIDFWADNCGACQLMLPVVDDLARERGDTLQVLKCDALDDSKFTKSLGISKLPAVLMFKDGVRVETVIGTVPKERLNYLVNKHLGLDTAIWEGSWSKPNQEDSAGGSSSGSVATPPFDCYTSSAKSRTQLSSAPQSGVATPPFDCYTSGSKAKAPAKSDFPVPPFDCYTSSTRQANTAAGTDSRVALQALAFTTSAGNQQIEVTPVLTTSLDSTAATKIADSPETKVSGSRAALISFLAPAGGYSASDSQVDAFNTKPTCSLASLESVADASLSSTSVDSSLASSGVSADTSIAVAASVPAAVAVVGAPAHVKAGGASRMEASKALVRDDGIGKKRVSRLAQLSAMQKVFLERIITACKNENGGSRTYTREVLRRLTCAFSWDANVMSLTPQDVRNFSARMQRASAQRPFATRTSHLGS